MFVSGTSRIPHRMDHHHYHHDRLRRLRSHCGLHRDQYVRTFTYLNSIESTYKFLLIFIFKVINSVTDYFFEMFMFNTTKIVFYRFYKIKFIWAWFLFVFPEAVFKDGGRAFSFVIQILMFLFNVSTLKVIFL